LNSIGFVWQIHQIQMPNATWEEKFQLLVEYKTKHKTIRVPKNSDPTLGSWIIYQRRNYRQGKLSKDRLQQLNSIGFVWQIRQTQMQNATWEEKFQLLVEYKKKHNTTRVPRSDRTLREWIQTQQTNRRQDKLSKYRLQRLNSVGFVWQFTWMEMYDQLISYRDQHDGSTSVPYQSIEYHRLARWVINLRSQYQQGKVSDERIALLESVGFQWQLVDKNQWIQMYQRLLTYKKKHGTTRIPQSVEADPQLLKWVVSQRQSCKNKDRINLLNDIDFEWTLGERHDWGVMYHSLLSYKKKHGTICIPEIFKADPQLGQWVYTQRRQCKDKDRIDLLNDIGFVWKLCRSRERLYPAESVVLI